MQMVRSVRPTLVQFHMRGSVRCQRHTGGACSRIEMHPPAFGSLSAPSRFCATPPPSTTPRLATSTPPSCSVWPVPAGPTAPPALQLPTTSRFRRPFPLSVLPAVAPPRSPRARHARPVRRARAPTRRASRRSVPSIDAGAPSSSTASRARRAAASDPRDRPRGSGFPYWIRRRRASGRAAPKQCARSPRDFRTNLVPGTH